MKLLQSEIDVVPGRKPQKQPLPEGYVGTGIGTLRIDNTTERQNSYTIRIKCDEPYWQDAWCTISALPPAAGAENAPPSGKPDQPGPRNQSLTIFIKDRGVRDVLLSFALPEKSECRAGVYRATVVVETRVVSDDPHMARKERITELPITVIVRPFYRWQVSFSPEERRVGLFRRRADFEVAVDNQGNDWLYVDLKLPRPQNVLVDTKVQRLAVPPPEPGRESIRIAPVRANTRQRVIRGSRTPTPLPVTVQRTDAPSIPPLPETAAYGPSSANLGAAVVAADTNDIGVPAVPSKVVYCPPIPDTFTGFLEALMRNLRGLVAVVIGGILAWQLLAFTYELYLRNITELRVSRSQVSLGEAFRIHGKNLVGSQILVFDPETKQQLGEPMTPKIDAHGAMEDYVTVTLTDSTLNNRKVIIGAQRLGKMTFLNRFLPVVKDPSPVIVGQLLAKTGPPSGSVTANVAPGEDLTIGGENFGASQGKVLIDGNPAKIDSWQDSTIKAKVPSSKQVGDTFSVAAFTADGTSIPISPATVSIKPPGGEMPVDQEPQIGPNGEPIAPSGGGSPSRGGGGASPPAAIAGGLPGAYNLLLTDNRSDYVKAVGETRNASSPGALAVEAYALAALNRDDEATSAARKALQAIGDRKTGKDLALCVLALSKVVEQKNPAKAADGYAMADTQSEQAAPGFAFKDIVIARYKISAGSNFEAKVILKDALRKSLSDSERSSVQQLLRKVGG